MRIKRERGGRKANLLMEVRVILSALQIWQYPEEKVGHLYNVMIINSLEVDTDTYHSQYQYHWA